MFVVVAFFLIGCDESSLSKGDDAAQDLIDVAETSGQLASGASFRIAGSSTDSLRTPGHHIGKDHHGRHHGILDGVSLLAPTDELLAITEAESAGDFRGLRVSKNGGATITHYDASGNQITLPVSNTGGPNGCSFSGNQFPLSDSLLSRIAKTVIDFRTGITYKSDSVLITRSGKILISRTGDSNGHTETVIFESYKVNGIGIEGVKTRVSNFDSATGQGTSSTIVRNGKFTFTNGTSASWESVKTRTSDITRSENNGRPTGKIMTEVDTRVATQGGTVLFSNQTTAPLVENIGCSQRRHGPVSGVLETVYRENTIVVDYGDGTCDNRTITITINGVTTTKTIGL